MLDAKQEGSSRNGNQKALALSFRRKSRYLIFGRGYEAALERKGQAIGGYDVLIAGHARSRGLAVVTGNLVEFGRVEGLRCEDWAEEA